MRSQHALEATFTLSLPCKDCCVLAFILKINHPFRAYQGVRQGRIFLSVYSTQVLLGKRTAEEGRKVRTKLRSISHTTEHTYSLSRDHKYVQIRRKNLAFEVQKILLIF